MLPRLHLFEFEDLKWFPKFLRGYITDLLTYQIVNFGIYEAVVPEIKKVLEKTGVRSVVDLCSGSGGPSLGVAKKVSEQLGENVHLYLTDKFPNKKVLSKLKSQSVTPILDSLDATKISSDKLDQKGMRTLFTSFHHFKPKSAKKILQDAVDNHVPVAIFEITERKLASLMTLLVAPITCLIFSLFIKPRKIGRFFWTYLCPIVPLLYTWDGLVSNARTYSPEELMDMTKQLKQQGNVNYSWKVGHLVSKFHIKVNYLIGFPK